MTLPAPILDDRSFEQLREALLQRIPVFNPEWSDHNPADPGITLLELFAYLGENLLFRFNQIPESTYLAYLRLLQVPLQSARPARALLALSTEEAEGVLVEQGREARGQSSDGKELPFELSSEVRVLPMEAQALVRVPCPLPDPATEPQLHAEFQRVVDALGDLEAEQAPQCYELAALDIGREAGGADAVDLAQSVDGVLWVAVLAKEGSDASAMRSALAGHAEAPLVMNLGVVPDLRSSAPDQTPPCPGPETAPPTPAVEWQISSGLLDQAEQPIYQSLEVVADSSAGLSREGVVRLQLPLPNQPFGPFLPDDPDLEGTGDLPPAIEPEMGDRVLFWLRAFRPDGSSLGSLRLLVVNAAEAWQQRRARPEFLGTGNGQPNQVARLAHSPVVPQSLQVEVEEDGGWQAWRAVDGLHACGPEDRCYQLDSARGELRFGDGNHGWPPQIGQRIRALGYHHGGGAEGNVAAGNITRLPGVGRVELSNPLPAWGGADTEAIERALDRIPGELRRRDRAVTPDDFRELAMMTPGVVVGRAECLPRFHPPTRQTSAAGVVTVVVWPEQDLHRPSSPMPDRRLLRGVCEHLDPRRLVTTELYVVPPRYRRVAVAVGLRVAPGHGVEAMRRWAKQILQQFLSPLPPYGPSGNGWPLGRRVHGPELEAAVLQVEGVEYLEDLRVAAWDEASGAWAEGTVELALDEVPDLAAVTVREGPASTPGAGLEPPPPARRPVPVPVLREEC